MNNIVIKGGNVFDGEQFIGKKDILIEAGKINSLGKISSSLQKNCEVINAEGKIVAPGFVDIHANSTHEQLSMTDGASALAQGVTTQVVGNCGRSGDYYKTVEEALDHISRFGKIPLVVNVATLFGHNTLRQVTMQNPERVCTTKELNVMLKVLEQAFKKGAIGFSTGLMYSPGMFAEEKELVELLKKTAQRGKIHAIHLRDEGDLVENAVDEALRISSKAGVSLQISHLKVVGENNAGKASKLLKSIDSCKNIDVCLDVYPYDATSTVMKIILPKEIIQKFGENFNVIPETPEILDCINKNGKQILCPDRWADIMISRCANPKYYGRSIVEIAQGSNPVLTFLKILREDPKVYAVFRNIISQKDICEIMKHPNCFIASDGYIYDTKDKETNHPRSFGTFTAVLSKFVRDKKILELEDALRKMTSLPAKKFNLIGRGFIKEGAFADISIFLLEKIKSKDTYENPANLSEGMDYVLVNGVTAYSQGKALNTRSGKFLI